MYKPRSLTGIKRDRFFTQNINQVGLERESQRGDVPLEANSDIANSCDVDLGKDVETWQCDVCKNSNLLWRNLSTRIKC
jgi:hypothetical protein